MRSQSDLGLVVIGASWGGLAALRALLGSLPESFPLPIAIVQHRATSRKQLSLAELLSSHTHLPVCDAEDKSPLVSGCIHLAPADYHLLIEGENLALSLDDPVLFSRPSIDVLFESAAESWGSRVCGVVLTGVNADGADGLRAIHRGGGPTIVEDPRTAEQAAMPQAALDAVPEAMVLSIDQIGGYLSHLIKGDG